MSNPADRFHGTGQWEHLQSKQVDSHGVHTTRHDFAVQIHRDCHAAFVGNKSVLHYLSMVEGEHPRKMFLSRIESMLEPCGPKPKD
ncbi:hypothetical protein P9112_002432 [Eukaryota sp. TZLM1-RC]